MIIGYAILVQISHTAFVKCKKGDPEIIKIPALGREIFRGDFLVLEDKLTGERLSVENISQTVCEYLKGKTDEKGLKIPKNYTLKVQACEIEQDIYKID